MKNLLFFQYPWRLWRERLAGVHRYARKAGCRVSVAEYGRNFASIREALRFWRPDGLIVEGGYTELPGFHRSDFKGYPVVFCDARASRMGESYCGVEHDSSQTAALAARELLSLGFPHYAFVGNLQPREWSDSRRDVFAAAVAEAGRVVSVFESGRTDDFVAFRSRLRTFLAALPRPCGLLAANDATADIVLRVLRNMRVKVPEEIAVAGIDNDVLICENALPTLTSVAPDFEKSGYLAAELLGELVRGRTAEGRILAFGSTQVVRRESTRLLKRRDDGVRKALEFIRAKAKEGISARDVAVVIGGCRRQAEYRFREHVGKSIGEEILSVRLETAKKMLASPFVSIGEIAARCGYGNGATLRRAFRAATGVSLSDYRRMHS